MGSSARRSCSRRGSARGRSSDGSRSGRLHPLYRGVYAVGHRVVSQRGRWMAATLATGGVLSHRSAARPLGHPPVERPDRGHDALDEDADERDSSFTEPFSPTTRSRPTTASPSPPPPAPSSTWPASSRSTSSSRRSTRPRSSGSTEPKSWRNATRRRKAPPTSARSRHRPTPDETSRPASPPSSMTAVSRRPRPTSSSKGRGRLRLARPQAHRRARQLRVPPDPGEVRARSTTRPQAHRRRLDRHPRDVAGPG